MFITTLNDIRKHRPCQEGWTRLLESLGKTKADDDSLMLESILESNGLDDAIWCLRAVKGKDREVRLFAVWCARQVKHLMRDERSIRALDVTERFANGDVTRNELAAAREEAWAAERVAARATEREAALAAAWAAERVAARAAAWDAARAAAWAAARAAARAAAWAAARDAAWAAARAAARAAEWDVSYNVGLVAMRRKQEEEFRRMLSEGYPS